MSDERDPNLEFLAALDKDSDDTAKVRALVAKAVARGYVLANSAISNRAKRLVMGKTVNETTKAILEQTKGKT